MSSRTMLWRTCATLVTLVVAWCGVGQHGPVLSAGAPRAADIHDARAIRRFGLGTVPQGFSLDRKHATAVRDFFALVIADLDADGDDDIIASNGPLDLRVWINDGAGHLASRTDADSLDSPAHTPARLLERTRRGGLEIGPWEEGNAPVDSAPPRIAWDHPDLSTRVAARADQLLTAVLPVISTRGPPA